MPRIEAATRCLTKDGSLFVHLDYHEVHYVKVALDRLLGRDHFMSESIWAYDYGARSKKRWPAKHDTILWYAMNPEGLRLQLRRDGLHPLHGAGARGPGEGRAREDAHRRVVAHDRADEREGEDGVPDAEAARRAEPHREGALCSPKKRVLRLLLRGAHVGGGGGGERARSLYGRPERGSRGDHGGASGRVWAGAQVGFTPPSSPGGFCATTSRTAGETRSEAGPSPRPPSPRGRHQRRVGQTRRTDPSRRGRSLIQRHSALPGSPVFRLKVTSSTSSPAARASSGMWGPR